MDAYTAACVGGQEAMVTIAIITTSTVVHRYEIAFK